jgi:CSLREA domain-containing protein
MKRILCVPALFLACGGVHANTIVVNSTAPDNIGVNSCTLRQAITAANTNQGVGVCLPGSPGLDTIQLPAASVFSLEVVDNTARGVNGLPVITESLRIVGNGSTIQRSESLSCDPAAPAAGKFRLMFNEAPSLELEHLHLANGCARASGNGDGSVGAGAALYSVGPALRLRRVGIVGNRSDIGAALTVTSAAEVVISESAFVANSSGALGAAAIALGDASTGVLLTMSNTTITGSSDGALPAVYAFGTMAISNVTIANNNGASLSLRCVSGQSQCITVKNSVAHDNAGNNCDFGTSQVVASGTNFSDDGTCTGFSHPNTNAMLGELDFHGGFTFNAVPQPGSPVIDAVTDCSSATGGLLPIDQRGKARPQDGNNDGLVRCDAGAVEVESITLFADGFEG